MNMARARAWRAVVGLSLGDAFGECFFGSPESVARRLEVRQLPLAPWRWTDDTAMALSIYEVLAAHGEIDADALAEAFARRFVKDPRRGYGGGAQDILSALARGVAWEVAASSVFDGQGSMGNGGAMRAAPVGAYFAEDLERVVAEARRSAMVTHAHPEGQAGAVAVAVAAALTVRGVRGGELLAQCAPWVSQGATRDQLNQALELPATASVTEAAHALGTGSRVLAWDTVPFSLWCAARHLDDFESALWTTVSGLGDRDTTCAIVGGIVALRVPQLPEAWLACREPLPLEG